MQDWSITFSLPHGLTVGGHTSWAIRMTNELLARGRRIQWVVHPPMAGFVELNSGLIPSSARFRLFRAPSMFDRSRWAEWVAAYRQTLPTVLLPAIVAESYAVASALGVSQTDQLRVIGWNHSDNPYDYAYLTRYEPIIGRYVVNTTACRRALETRLPGRIQDITFLRHGVAVCPATQRDSSPTRPIRIAYGGRFEQRVKRVLDFPRLARRLCEIDVSFEMRLAGDGPQAEQLAKDVASVKSVFAAASVTIEPPISPHRMAEFWSWADVAMLMSEHEGLSVAMLEAMAAGCVPVVTAVASGPRDVIDEGRTGLTFPVGDVKRASQHIVALGRVITQRRNMSIAARETIARDFSIENCVSEFLGLVDACTSDTPRAWPAHLACLPNHEQASSTADPELTVPAEASRRLTTLLERLAERGEGPAIIYGAGRHTRALAQALADSPIEIVAVADDDPTVCGRSLWGWPIVSPASAARFGARCVIISSWLHEGAMWSRRDCFERAGLRVHRIYGENESDGPTCDRTSRPLATHVV